MLPETRSDVPSLIGGASDLGKNTSKPRATTLEKARLAAEAARYVDEYIGWELAHHEATAERGPTAYAMKPVPKRTVRNYLTIARRDLGISTPDDRQKRARAVEAAIKAMQQARMDWETLSEKVHAAGGHPDDSPIVLRAEACMRRLTATARDLCFPVIPVDKKAFLASPATHLTAPLEAVIGPVPTVCRWTKRPDPSDKDYRIETGRSEALAMGARASPRTWLNGYPYAHGPYPVTRSEFDFARADELERLADELETAADGLEQQAAETTFNKHLAALANRLASDRSDLEQPMSLRDRRRLNARRQTRRGPIPQGILDRPLEHDCPQAKAGTTLGVSRFVGRFSGDMDSFTVNDRANVEPLPQNADGRTLEQPAFSYAFIWDGYSGKPALDKRILRAALAFAPQANRRVVENWWQQWQPYATEDREVAKAQWVVFGTVSASEHPRFGNTTLGSDLEPASRAGQRARRWGESHLPRDCRCEVCRPVKPRSLASSGEDWPFPSAFAYGTESAPPQPGHPGAWELTRLMTQPLSGRRPPPNPPVPVKPIKRLRWEYGRKPINKPPAAGDPTMQAAMARLRVLGS